MGDGVPEMLFCGWYVPVSVGRSSPVLGSETATVQIPQEPLTLWNRRTLGKLSNLSLSLSPPTCKHRDIKSRTLL